MTVLNDRAKVQKRMGISAKNLATGASQMCGDLLPCSWARKSFDLGTMKVVGITGGIGSGKSTVAKVFAQLGAPVYNSDERARALYQSDPQLRSSIVERFGTATYAHDKLQRQVLADLVFGHPEALADLNALVHPRVAVDFQNWQSEQQAPYLIKEAAILLETGGHKLCDEVILVSAPEQERALRVAQRDGVTVEDVQKRMAHQWTDAQRRPLCSIELVNNNQDLLTPQIEALDLRFRS